MLKQISPGAKEKENPPWRKSISLRSWGMLESYAKVSSFVTERGIVFCYAEPPVWTDIPSGGGIIVGIGLSGCA